MLLANVCFHQGAASLAGAHPVSHFASLLRGTYQEKMRESEKVFWRRLKTYKLKEKQENNLRVFFANYTFSFHLDTFLDIEDILTTLAGTP